MINLDWINDLIKDLPETSTLRKNIIGIAGYPKWENVNSNLLAFYLDEKEEHGFGRLFLNSILDILETALNNHLNREIYDAEFVVEREVSTDLGGRIDIVINADTDEDTDTEKYRPGWSIIIENKLFSDLHNNLTDYWQSTISDKKLGIVLTVDPVEIPTELKAKNIIYINILHKELVNKVKQNLGDYYCESDDRHLLFLKEYIANINSHYKDKNKMQELDRTLELFHSKKEEIDELKRVDMNLLKHVSNSVFTIMRNNGFPPYSTKDSSKTKHFHAEKDSSTMSQLLKDNFEITDMFRFWINIGKLRYVNSIEGVFELYGKTNTTYGDKLKLKLEKLYMFSEYVSIGTDGKSGAGYQHIYYFNIPILDFSNLGFENQLKHVLKHQLFEHDKNFIEIAVLELKKLVEENTEV